MKKINDVTLMHYLDGELTDEECKEVEKALAENPELHTQLEHLNASALPYEQAFSQAKIPPLPADTKQWVNHLCETTSQQTQRDHRFRQFKYAASLMLMFGAGVWLG